MNLASLHESWNGLSQEARFLLLACQMDPSQSFGSEWEVGQEVQLIVSPHTKLVFVVTPELMSECCHYSRQLDSMTLGPRIYAKRIDPEKMMVSVEPIILKRNFIIIRRLRFESPYAISVEELRVNLKGEFYIYQIHRETLEEVVFNLDKDAVFESYGLEVLEEATLAVEELQSEWTPKVVPPPAPPPLPPASVNPFARSESSQNELVHTQKVILPAFSILPGESETEGSRV